MTQLLARWKAGDEDAFAQLLPLVYRDLRAVAAKYLSRERAGHSLQATELVHEAYLRLAQVSALDAHDRLHFFTVAARAMRRILVDHARKQQAHKRVGAHRRISLEELTVGELEAPGDLLEIDSALAELEKRHPRPAQLVELRFFAGLSESETAEMLGVSRATATRDWRFARLWLFQFLNPDQATG
ncbi:MAG: ECF-type sigma factor [Acidobacteriota bacterium]